MDVGTVIMCGLGKKRILEAVKVVTSQHNSDRRVSVPVEDYQSENVSKQVVRIIISYVDYINQNVWKK